MAKRRGPAPGDRDEAAVSRFVERFASVLMDGGVPRMPARVFSALLATDGGRLTSAELAERLQVSPAAISGAVAYLQRVNLIGREREPGSRRDHFRLHDEVWVEAIVSRDQLISRWITQLRDGLEAVGPSSPAGERIAETLDFFEFVERDVAQMMDRWHAHRDALARKRRA